MKIKTIGFSLRFDMEIVSDFFYVKIAKPEKLHFHVLVDYCS